jgi:hypothetical protein
MGKTMVPCKFIQGISQSDIQGFSENAVSGITVSQHLGVGTACIKDDWIIASGCPPANLNVGDTVVYSDERNIQ